MDNIGGLTIRSYHELAIVVYELDIYDSGTGIGEERGDYRVHYLLGAKPYTEFDILLLRKYLVYAFGSAYTVDITYGNQKYVENLLLRKELT